MISDFPQNSASGSFLGYAAQIPHMLFELANHFNEPETVVAVEGLDDITVNSEEQTEITQLKNVTSHNNPVANSSIVFWKAIYNWCKLYEDNYIPLDNKCVFKFVVRSSYDLKEGSIISRLSNKNDKDEISNLLSEIENEYKKGDYALLSDSHFQYCLDKKNIDFISKVVSQFELIIYNTNYEDELKRVFFSQPLSSPINSTVYKTMLGWVVHTILNSKSHAISVKDYKKELVSNVRKQTRARLLASLSNNPSVEDVNNEHARCDTYIKQMDIIDLDIKTCMKGVSNYLRTKSEIVAQEDEGYSLPYDELETGIKDCWDNTKLVCDATCISEDEKVRGRALYGSVINNVASLVVGDFRTPYFFNQGYVQILSNEKIIGWHKDYLEILK